MKTPVLNCPTVICPDNVSIQQLDLDKIKKIKGGFTYSPVFNGDVIIKNDSCK